MKKRFTLISALLLIPSVSFGGDKTVLVKDVRVEQVKDSVKLEMLVDVAGLKLKGNEAMVLTPNLRGASATMQADFSSISILGRKQYIRHLRSGKQDKSLYPAGGRDRRVISYSASLPFEGWMEGAVLYISDSRKNCCKDLVGTVEDLYRQNVLIPEKPEVIMEEKAIAEEVPVQTAPIVYSIKGSALVTFPVNSWEILEDYQNNWRELGKIRRGIDSVLFIPNTRVKRIILKGFASPEGSYGHNADLAENRTLALKYYLLQKYELDPRSIFTEYEPEDWDGLRKLVENGYMPNKWQILGIIDSYRDPDSKEAILKSRYPSEWKFIVHNYFPLLRHTDYIIEYQFINNQTIK